MRIGILLFSIMLLTACGQTGSLYLTAKQKKTAAVQVAKAKRLQEKENTKLNQQIKV